MSGNFINDRIRYVEETRFVQFVLNITLKNSLQKYQFRIKIPDKPCSFFKVAASYGNEGV